MNKIIIIGSINESFKGTPSQLFKRAVELSKQEDFVVYTNNPQFVEALEVLCGANNVKIYIHLEGKYIEVDFFTAYNYLGDIYDTINAIRFKKQIKHVDEDDIPFNDYEFLENEINEYEEKYSNMVKKGA